ncbi:hypothetical protein BpHYR1_002645 [Brachionus plicatilis]|uniref:Uncharacterized protein n=1 Tax=Brachionus plicatilis TaxID=10195 RepID=A0A3M7QRK3_BRAPC|nr:hypothetical protein BpHYR1_002645 [Brachionus plicatilis]
MQNNRKKEKKRRRWSYFIYSNLFDNKGFFFLKRVFCLYTNKRGSKLNYFIMINVLTCSLSMSFLF